MKAEEIKAKELVNKFIDFTMCNLDKTLQNAIQCAIICVEEILKASPTCEEQFFYVDAQGNKTGESFFKTKSSYLFWQEVLTILKAM